MEQVNEIFAKNITMLRNKLNLTQLELAEKLNYSDKAVSRWERGEAIPDAKVLLLMSEIFEVSIDDMLKTELKPTSATKSKSQNNHINIAMISFIGVWTVALLAFIVTWLMKTPQWLIFVYALPVSLVVSLVFNSVWGKTLSRFFIVSLLIWSIIAAVYLTALFFEFNWWPLFLLGIPVQLIVVISFRFRR